MRTSRRAATTPVPSLPRCSTRWARPGRAGVTPNAVRPSARSACSSPRSSSARTAGFVGTLIITVFVMLDMVDGTVARGGGTASPFGAVLDSTSDRAADAAIFGAVALVLAARPALAAAGRPALPGAGSLTSYIRARAEAAGFTANVGIAERTERLIIVLVGAGLTGAPFHVPFLQAIALWALVGLSDLHGRAAAGHRTGSRSASTGRRRADVRRGARSGSPVAWSTSATPPAGAGPGGARRAVAPRFQAVADAATVRNGGGARQLRANLRRVVGPELPELRDGRPGRRRAALVLPLLAGDVPAAEDGQARHRRARRHATTAPSTSPRRSTGQGRGGGAAAHGQLGRRRHLAGRAHRLVHHGRGAAQAGVAVRPVRRVPRGAGMEILPLTGGARPPFDVLARAAAPEQGRLPGRRPRPVPARRRGRLLRRTDPDAGRAGAARCHHRRPAAAVSMWFTPDGVGAAIDPGLPVPADRLRERCPPLTQAMADAVRAGIAAHPPTGTCCSGCGWPTCRHARPRRRERRRADRHRVPVLLGHPRRGAGTTSGTWPSALIGLGHQVSVLAPGDEDTPGLPPYVVTAGRAVPIPYNGSVARLQFGLVAPPGCAAGCATATSTWCTCTSRPRRACRCWPACSRGPVVATFHAAMARSRLLSMSTPCCSRSWRRSPAGSRSPRRPARSWSSTSAATPW